MPNQQLSSHFSYFKNAIPKLISGFFCILLLVSNTTDASQQPTLPNIVVYLSDDHSLYDSSLYGSTDIPTPNLLKLAAEGMNLTQAYVASPSCAPSRAALLTGLMPARNGAEDNHSYPREGIKSLIGQFNQLGYQTVAIGKVSHGKQKAKRFDFDYFEDEMDLGQLRVRVQKFFANRSSKKPLLLFVGSSNPHVPWPLNNHVDPANVVLPPTHLDTPDTRAHRAAYYQEIIDMDAYLGELHQLVKEQLGEDHVFLHTSDHGGQWPFGKWTLYDYGLRVPMLVSWPGHIDAGSQSAAMLSLVDVLPTLLQLAGGHIPDDIDGLSFANVLTGKRVSHRSEIFATHTGDKKMNVYPSRAVRTADWKLIYNLHPEFAFTSHSDLLRNPGAGRYWTEWITLAKKDNRAQHLVEHYYQRPEFELYKVPEDKWEQVNLANKPEYAAIKQKLLAQLQAWQVKQGDQESVLMPPYLLADPVRWAPDNFPFTKD